MQLDRRGFLGTLGGLILGAVVGPRAIAAPTAEAWREAPSLFTPHPEPIRSYLSLEVFSSAVVMRVGELLKHLRREHFLMDAPWASYDGQMAAIRPPLRFEGVPLELLSVMDLLSLRPAPMLEHVVVRLDTPIHSRSIPIDGGWPDWKWPQVEDRMVEPTAHGLAEAIIDRDRYRGGSDYIVAAPMALPADLERALNVKDEASQLAVRTTLCRNMSRGDRELRCDMLVGFGDKSRRW